MRIFIIGAGAVGSYYGGLLANNGSDLTFLCRSSTTKSRLESGLTIKDKINTFTTTNFSITTQITELVNADLIIIAVKSYDLENLAKSISPYINENAIILTLQNGIDADQVICKYIKKNSIFAGITRVLASIESGIIVQAADEKFTYIQFGSRTIDKDASKLSVVKSIFDNYGVQSKISEDITADLWTKFIWISNFAGLTGSKNCSLSEIANDTELSRVFISGMDEVISLSKSLNVMIGTP